MRRVLTTVLAVALLLGLGALAVLALPNAGAPLAGAPAVSAAAPEFQPEAPTATSVYNVIGMPLGASQQFTSAGYGFDSDGLGSLIGTSVKQVLRWNVGRQDFDSWDPINNEGYVNGDPVTTPWALQVGGAYWLLVDNTSPTVVSFVGDVPAAGSIKFTFSAAANGCTYNQITVPLEQSTVTDADLLAESIANKLNPPDVSQVSQVLQWNGGRQDFDSWDAVNNEGYLNGDPVTTPWVVKIGYPYMVCLKAAANGVVWP